MPPKATSTAKKSKLIICKCDNNHLITEQEYNEQTQNIKKLLKKNFEFGGLFVDMHLSPRLPLNSDLIHYMFRDLSSYNCISDNTCFKSNKYQINLLKEIYQWRYDLSPSVSNCCTYLKFY